MLPKNAVVALHASAIFIIIIFIANNTESSIDSQAFSANHTQFECSKTCVVEDCNMLWMRYGKYCGVGYSGCPGEKPCDDLDACCQLHDECVDQHGMANIECHEDCKRCISKIGKSGKVGFSNSCPYDVAVPTLVECMDVSILFSQHDSSKAEL